MKTWTFAKGHGTMNDFVIVQDRHELVSISDDEVRFLCDRRAGVGGDGLLRVTLASSIPEWDGDPDLWFMDYRNADGSIAEMCGNGLRVFGRYLLEQDLVPHAPMTVATRAGLRSVTPLVDGRLRNGMGRVVLGDEPVEVRLADGSGGWAATTANVGNPHAVCFVSGSLDELDLTKAPSWSPAQAFPQGTNVEFVHEVGERHIAMRVFERGAGETMSCGTGTVAAAAAYARRRGLGDGEVRVDVPGGTLVVGLEGFDQTSAEATLTGPAVIVAHGQVQVPDGSAG